MRLRIDGEDIEPRVLDSLTERLAKELAAAGAGVGAGVELCEDGALVATVATLAVRRTGATLLFRGPRRRALPGRRIVSNVVTGADGVPAVAPRAQRDGAAFPPSGGHLFWTSGTTGRARAVLYAPEAVAYQVDATVRRLRLDSRDEFLVPLPLWHAYGFSLLQIALALGASLNVVRGVSVSALSRELRRATATSLDGIPAMYRLLGTLALRDRDLAADLRRLRIRGCGGERLTQSSSQRFASIVGAPLHDGYGLTEAGPNVAINANDGWREGSVGRPLDGTDVRIDDNGEILVKSPSVVTGYFDDDSSDDLFDASGYLRTGDVGLLADGFLFVHGRRKEVLVLHGESIAPADIEEALAMDGTVECAAIGERRADSDSDAETVTLFVESKRASAEHGALKADLARIARRSLPHAMRPRRIVVLDTLPRVASGKVDRAALRAMLPRARTAESAGG